MEEKKEYFDSSNLLVFLYKFKETLLVVLIASIVLSSIIAFLIPIKYKSVSVVYPSSTSSIAKALINSELGGKSDIMEFGEEEKTEQLLEILNSEQVRTRIVEEFQLMKHYDISPDNSSTPNTDLLKEYEKNIRFKRNVNMAVEIEVYDRKSDTAALIANRVVEVADEVINKIQKERSVQGFEIVKKAYQEKVNEISKMEDSLKVIMKKGVLDVESQAEVYTNAYAQALAKGNGPGIKALEEKMGVISKYGSQFLGLKENLENERLKLSDLRSKYDEARVDAEENLQNFFVVTRAYPAEKKSYPIRWLIVTMSAIGAMLVAFLSILLFEQLQTIKSRIQQ